MIQKLNIKGYRSLRDVTWEPGRLNVLIGPNGSGKSNLLRALGLLRAAATGKLSEAILHEGGFGALVWDGRAQEVSWTVMDRAPTDETVLAYRLTLERTGPVSGYRVKGEHLVRTGSGIAEDEAMLVNRSPSHAELTLEGKRVGVSQNHLNSEQPLLSLATLPLPLNESAESIAIWGFAYDLSEWSLYQDLRVDQEAPLRQAAIARVEKKIATDGQNLIPVLHTLYTGDREFKSSIDSGMRAAFGPDYEELVFPPAADQRVQLRIRWRSLRSEQSAANLSDGTLRFLLLLAILTSPEPGPLVAIDQPEAALHPSMLPVIAELAADAAERTQVILTTHSPQLLDAFAGQTPTTTVATWEDGETRLSIVDGEELKRWLRDYSLGSLFRSGELEALA